MALVNYENVVAAAEALIADGQKASVRKVIDRLGGGSPNAVLKLLGEYKAGRPVIRVADVDLDPAIVVSIKRQMQAIAAEAAVAAEERASALSDDLQTLSEAQQAAEQELEALKADKAMLEDVALELRSKLHDQELEAAQNLQSAQARIDELVVDLGKERERANSAQQDLGKAQAKAETVPIIESLVTKLQGELETERKERAAADQRTAVAEAQIKLVNVQVAKAATDAEKSGMAHKDALAQLRQEFAASAEKANQEHKDAIVTLRQDLTDARQAIRDAADELKSARKQIDALHEQLSAAQKTANTPSPINQTEGSSNA